MPKPDRQKKVCQFEWRLRGCRSCTDTESGRSIKPINGFKRFVVSRFMDEIIDGHRWVLMLAFTTCSLRSARYNLLVTICSLRVVAYDLLVTIVHDLQLVEIDDVTVNLRLW